MAAAFVMATFAAEPAHAQPAPEPTPVGEAGYIKRFCAAGPIKARAAALVAQGQAGVDVASVVPNPTIAIEHNRSLSATEDTETIVGIGFPLGIGGRRFLLSDAADEHLDEKSAEARALLLEAALDLREGLVRAVADRERVAVLEAQQEALAALGATLAGLKTGGEVSEHDLLRQGLELEVHTSRVALQKGRAAAARARLRAYLGSDVDVGGLALATIASDVAPASSPLHPTVESLDASIRAAEYEEEAADRRWVPDLEIFFGYRQVTALETEMGHGFALRIAMPITFFDHGQGEASVAQAQIAEARAEKAAFVATKESEAAAADEALAALDGSGAAAQDTVDRANKLLEQAKKLYLAGEGSISDLLAASALAESTALARIDTEEARALARIAKMRAVGSLFDPELDSACGVSAP